MMDENAPDSLLKDVVRQSLAARNLQRLQGEESLTDPKIFLTLLTPC
jgi:hypothetical protein